MTSFWRAFLALLLIVAPTAARADERILHYSSDVSIQPDSSLEVTETIDIRAENDAIKHGIFRDFPTRYRGPHGNQFRVGFTFEGATLDGASVPASTMTSSTGMRPAMAGFSRSMLPTHEFGCPRRQNGARGRPIPAPRGRPTILPTSSTKSRVRSRSGQPGRSVPARD